MGRTSLALPRSYDQLTYQIKAVFFTLCIIRNHAIYALHISHFTGLRAADQRLLFVAIPWCAR